MSLKLDAKVRLAFFSFDNSIRISMTDVAGCLLRQLCILYGSIPPLVKTLYESHRQGIPITIKQLLKAIEGRDEKISTSCSMHLMSTPKIGTICCTSSHDYRQPLDAGFS